MYYVSRCMVLAFLGVSAWVDKKCRSLALWWFVLAILAGVLFGIVFEGAGMRQIFCDISPGAFLVLFSLLSKGMIGAGDGMTVLVVGLWCGWRTSLCMVMWGCVLMAVLGTALIVLRRIDKSKSLPFVPFLLVGYVLGLV